MPDILHRGGIGLRPESVYVAQTTIDGLRQWWVVETTGTAQRRSLPLLNKLMGVGTLHV